MRIVRYDNKIIPDVISVLEKGGLVVTPSDTVYGILADATNKNAVEKLIKLKSRPIGRAISVFVADFFMLAKYVDVKKNQWGLVKKLLPGPFTLVLPSKNRVCSLLESEKKSLGVRIPKFEFINQIVNKFGKPVTATSANLSGRLPHYQLSTFIKELSQEKQKLIDLVVDAGKLPRNKPSTVVDLSSQKLKILRQGDVAFKNVDTFISSSPGQTKRKAQSFIKKILKEKVNKPIVFILKGELGVGKTVFVSGLAGYLGITNIVSPSFVVYYEYSVKKTGVNNFIHVDLYNVEEEEEFRYLGLDKYLEPGNILCFEWGEKAGEIIDLLKDRAKITYVKMRYIDENKREIVIK